MATSKNSLSKSHSKPFPALDGSCFCNAVRYRLLTAPLFVYACHCRDCQKSTGSAFGYFLHIESFNLRLMSTTRPILVIEENGSTGRKDHFFACPECKTRLWTHWGFGPTVVHLRVGTLAYPSLMEPDLHTYVGSKLEWLQLPSGAKTTLEGIDHTKHWPKASLKRLELCKEQTKRMMGARKAAAEQAQAPGQAQNVKEAGIGGAVAQGSNGKVNEEEEEDEDETEEGEKTPTASEFGGIVEDDEAFEKRFRETERALQQRLEKLSLKLAADEEAKGISKK